MRTLLFVTTTLVFATACRKKAEPPAVAAVEAPTPAPAPHDHTEVIEQLVEQFQRVHFELDSAALSEASMEALAGNAKILQAHPKLNVEIQGHADERGTSDYNLALGDKRANAVMGYLAEMGVGSARLKVISFGEERPAAAGGNEDAWSKNRRCEFRIIDRQGGIVGTVDD